jgi:acyl-[acyl carrier protein]--UDP-N-acetylglucosamine O-acyltransferase
VFIKDNVTIHTNVAIGSHDLERSQIVIGDHTCIGEHTAIFENVRIASCSFSKRVIIGNDCILCSFSNILGDSRLENGVVLGGGVTVQPGVRIMALVSTPIESTVLNSPVYSLMPNMSNTHVFVQNSNLNTYLLLYENRVGKIVKIIRDIIYKICIWYKS